MTESCAHFEDGTDCQLCVLEDENKALQKQLRGMVKKNDQLLKTIEEWERRELRWEEMHEGDAKRIRKLEARQTGPSCGESNT